MLFFAKPQKPSLMDIKLAQAIEDSVSMLVPLIQIRGIHLSTDLNDAVVKSDSELMKQVFMNIILNAVQAMPDGGNLRIVTAETDEHVTASVIDDGEGVDPQYIEKIFDPFFSTKDKGTGLGLAIAHKIMQSQGGFIRAYKNKEKGSTFCVSFPKIHNQCSDDMQEKYYEKAGA
jgi:signal transduction histidine kinase